MTKKTSITLKQRDVDGNLNGESGIELSSDGWVDGVLSAIYPYGCLPGLDEARAGDVSVWCAGKTVVPRSHTVAVDWETESVTAVFEE